MLKNDLKQIKQIVDTSVKHAIDTSVKQIVDKSLDEKLDKKFKENNKSLDKKFRENNKKIFKKIDKVKNELLDSTQDEFSDNTIQHNHMNKSLKEINTKLKTKTSLYDLEDWKFDQRFKEDINALKYVNIDKLKNLPSTAEINNALIKEGIK